ncbi:MAG: cell wall-binding protein [Lachnospiraceae bacterium]|nr:cell wall-binding protein [Lachnospiraceae bacterium]
MKKQTRMLAVLSAAAFMTMIAPVSGPAGAVFAAEYGWTEEEGSRVHYDEDGYLTTDSWRRDGEDWYYLDEDGMISRNTKIDEYYVDGDGKMVKNTWLAIANEEDSDSPEAPDSYWYYFGKDGKAIASQWLKQNEKWYYFDEEGRMLTGKAVIDGATYYLGDANDGAMKTGWISLEDNASNPGAVKDWYYFNADGKMVETQYDKKIGNDYYTFIDGKMQTGWVRMPGADTDVSSIADFRYYGAPGDGRRAEGWKTIEGIDGIHTPHKTSVFYFKEGKAYASETEGNSLFTIDSKKYAFNGLGEMQTGRQIVNLENGEIANFCFGDDGIMKTGKQSVFNEMTGETETWYFHTEGAKRGQGYHGILDNVLYVYGKRQEAGSGQRYAAAEFNDVLYLVNTSGVIQKATASSTSSSRPELGRGHKDFKDAAGTVWVTDTNGIIR